MRTILIALMLTVVTAAAGQEVPETAAEHGLRASFNFPGCPNPIGQEGQPGAHSLERISATFSGMGR